METPQFCGWLHTVIYDSYAEIDRLTEENKKLTETIDDLSSTKAAVNASFNLADMQLQQQIQQLEKELEQAKIVERIVVEYDTGLDAADKPYAVWDVFVEFKKPLLEIRPMIHWHEDKDSTIGYAQDLAKQFGVPCEIIEAKKTK
jgi:hypothetical protein